jgi:hypothetical protein
VSGIRRRRLASARASLLLAVATALASCPLAEPDEVDARAFIEELFRANFVCAPSFLGEAEPTFVRARGEAQVDVAVATFTRHLANDRVTFRRSAYDACLEAARRNDCPIVRDEEGPCADIFQGTLDEDAVCAEDVECGPGLSCFQERDACGVCKPLAVTGDSCAESDCIKSDFCDRDTSVCRRKPELDTFVQGQPCSPQPGCGGLLTGLQCINSVCRAITVVGEGETCEIGLGATRHCRDSATTHVCDAGQCARRPRLGAECATFCDVTEAICREERCIDEGQPGDPCASPLGCQLGSTCEGEEGDRRCVAFADVPLPPRCP